MAHNLKKETKGAWIIHHGRKVALDANGAAEFPAIDEASKAANLLTRLGETENATLSKEEVVAVAKATCLNPRHELRGLLETLEEKRLIDRVNGGVNILGVTTRGSLSHAATFFDEAEPSKAESASIDLAEKTSEAPTPRKDIAEFIGDTHKMKNSDTADFLVRAVQIGFVDTEGVDDSQLFFNGNLFRRESVEKASKVLDSLSSAEQEKYREFDELLKASGCVNTSKADQILGVDLFEKLKAAAVFDLNTVSNDFGEHVFVTSPGAFHKFVDPLVDDCFDLAKALVSALTYGMTKRSPSQGRIFMIDALLRKLIMGQSIGPATAIGLDYNVLELSRVVKITPDADGRLYYMRLLKREIGELALQVLTTGNANATALNTLPGAPMSGYLGPEESRTRVRKRQSTPSRKATLNILSALRSGRTI